MDPQYRKLAVVLHRRQPNKTMKMYDAGEKMDSMIDSPVSDKKKVYYPHLDFDSNQFPEIDNVKVGDTCMLEIEVKSVRYSKNESGGKEAKSSMCFEVIKVGMSDDQNEPSEKKVDKMVEKMYPTKKDDTKK